MMRVDLTKAKSQPYKPRIKWRKGVPYNEAGYELIEMPDGWRLYHRVIAENVLGRPLKSHEHVHHIDSDKTNNKNNNLLICTREYHMMLHDVTRFAKFRSQY